MLDRAIQLAVNGRVDDAITLLTEVLRLSPRLWQAFQYRGELYLAQQRADAALEDFDAAIDLAGNEPHLCRLREKALVTNTSTGGQETPE